MEFEGNKETHYENLLLKNQDLTDKSANLSYDASLGQQMDKNLQVENTEDVIKYSHLILEGKPSYILVYVFD
jgi:hypothetical protein